MTSSIKAMLADKERDYDAYQARQNFLREQRTIQHELDEEHKARLEAEQREQAAVNREQAALADKQAALAEVERLKALLAKNNLH